MRMHVCRSCHGQSGHLVLDLGEQPPCDYFPPAAALDSDPVYPLQMWLCSYCGLAQLVSDPTVREEPRGVESAALVSQAVDALRKVRSAGLLRADAKVAEYGSPHGGSWLGMLGDFGLVQSDSTSIADVVLDCFGLMHAADQATALAERAARVAPGGVLLIQYHSLETIVRKSPRRTLKVVESTSLRPLACLSLRSRKEKDITVSPWTPKASSGPAGS